MKNKKKDIDASQNDSLDSEIINDVDFVESTEEGEDLSNKDKIKKLRNDLKLCRQEKENYLVGWQRAKADYVNLQKELEQIRNSSSLLAKENMIINLLPVLDSFSMAFNNKDAWQKVGKEWRTGIEHIYQQFLNGLSASGIEKIETIDVPFNPQIHHSIKIINTKEKEKDHTVAEILQVGYEIKNPANLSEIGRVIRPASVNIYEYKPTSNSLKKE